MPKKPDICKSEGCRNKRRKDRRVCHTCHNRNYRASNPMKAAYDALRHNAKRRKKYFDLTFEQFKKLAIETDYINLKGRSAHGYTLDRDKDELGYTSGNINVMTNSDNVKKEHRRRKLLLEYNWQTRTATFKEIKDPDTGEVPF